MDVFNQALDARYEPTCYVATQPSVNKLVKFVNIRVVLRCWVGKLFIIGGLLLSMALRRALELEV